MSAEEGPASLTETQVNTLYTRGLIGKETWSLVLRMFRGDPGPAGPHALRTCEVAIESLVERAVDAACAVIQERLGVKTGDLAAAVLSDGTIERELTRYVHAELAVVDGDDHGATGEPDAPGGSALAFGRKCTSPHALTGTCVDGRYSEGACVYCGVLMPEDTRVYGGSPEAASEEP